MKDIYKFHFVFNMLSNKIETYSDRYAVYLLVSGIWIFVFSDYIIFRRSFVFDQFAIDTLSQFFPIEYFRLSNLLEGRFPFWSFNFDLGIDVYALMANTNPFDLIFLLFGPDQFIDAMPVVVYLKYLAAGLFFHAFLKKLSVEPVAALIGTLLFTFSGHMVINSHWYHYSNYVVFIAVFLFLFELWFQEGRWLPLVMVVGLVALKGELQLFQMGCFGAVYVFWRSLNRFGWSLKILRTYAILGCLYLLGLCVGAYVYLPNVMAMFSSSRVKGAVQDLTLLERIINFISIDSWPTIQVVYARLFSADMLGSWIGYRGMFNYFEDSTLYVGLLPVLLLPFAFFAHKKNRLVWLFPFSAFIAICFPSIRFALNGCASGTFKYVSLYGGFFLLFPAILLLSYLFKEKGASGRMAIDRVSGIVVFGLLLLMVACLFTGPDLLFSGVRVDLIVFKRTVILAIVYLVLLLILFFTGRTQALKYCLLVLVVVEVALSARMTAYRNPGALTPFFAARGENFFNSGTMEAVDYLAGRDQSFYRIEKGYTDGHLNDPLIQSYFGTQSYFGFAPGGVVEFYQALGLSRRSPRLASYRYGFEKRAALQSLFAVKYFLCRNDDQCSGLEGFTPIDTVGDVRIYGNEHVWPFGRIFHRQLGKHDFAALSIPEKDKALLDSVIVEEPLGRIPLYIPSASQKTYEEAARLADQSHETLLLEYWDQELFLGRITAREEGVLFFPVPYDHGWHLEVNGRPAELLQIDFGFCGAYLPAAGEYEVELHYIPPFFSTALLISCISLAAALLLRLFMPRIHVARQEADNGGNRG